MAKFRIESQITLLAVIIAAAVITSGYFAWKSLSEIVTSIHEEALPDNRLFLMKDIANDLTAIENNVRIFVLTNNRNNLESYDSLKSNVTGKIQSLYATTPPLHTQRTLVDSFRSLAISKVELWQGLLELHRQAEGTESEFSGLMEELEEDFDTITTMRIKEGFFRRLFGKPKVTTDTTITERKLQKEELREQIRELQNEMSERDEQLNILESNLVAQNIVFTNKINQLISEAEQNEAQSLLEETREADRLASVTYKRLAGFSVAAVILLLLVLFLLFNYLKKARSYEKGLKKAQREAENLARAKERFTANVSHEMRTPVNAIYGLAEQLLQRKNNDELNEQIVVLAQAASHLNNIINDTLDFTKIQTGKIKFRPVHFSPTQVLEEVVSLQKYNAIGKGIGLNHNFSDRLPEAIYGDPLRLRQIVINVLGNAVKFTEKGAVTFKADAQAGTENQINLHLLISDTGIGISKADLDVIFDEFVQAENHEGKKYRGTGLGLAIVKQLTELQGGKIKIESEPGTGTTVFISIPYPIGNKDQIQPEIYKPAEKLQLPGQLKILIADDEEFNRFLFKGIFRKWNIPYREAINGHEAVEAAFNDDFDIILMDIRMPGKNGFEATKEILEEKPGSKIIAITATTDEAEKEDCRKAGMIGFLPKPFSENQLLNAIHSATGEDKKSKTAGKPKRYAERIKEMAGGDAAFLKEMIDLFIRSSRKNISSLEDAIRDKDWKTVSDSAHQLAPQCKQLGANDLYDKIKTLEKEAEQKMVDESKLTALFPEIENEMKAVNRELKELQEESQN